LTSFANDGAFGPLRGYGEVPDAGILRVRSPELQQRSPHPNRIRPVATQARGARSVAGKSRALRDVEHYMVGNRDGGVRGPLRRLRGRVPLSGCRGLSICRARVGHHWITIPLRRGFRNAGNMLLSVGGRMTGAGCNCQGWPRRASRVAGTRTAISSDSSN
jgi:hypothetical protein